MRDSAPSTGLAVGEDYSVSRCGCGWIHVRIGSVTVRLEPEAFHELASAVADASTALKRDAAPGHTH